MFIEAAGEGSPGRLQQKQENPPRVEAGLKLEHARGLASPASPPADASARDGSGELAALACSPIFLPHLADTGCPDKQEVTESRKKNKGQLTSAHRPALTPCINQANQDGSATPPHVEAATNSDGKVARFLSLLPQVTLQRGGRKQRAQQQATSHGWGDTSQGEVGPGLLGSLQGVGSAERPGSSRSGAYSCGKISRHAPCGATPGSHGLQEATAGGAGSTPEASHTSADIENAPDSATPEQGTNGCRSLPATTLIRLGPRLKRSLPTLILEEVAERHSLPGLAAGNVPEALTFHSSAVAVVQGGPELEFVAGS
jgi:hypothetical protein